MIKTVEEKAKRYDEVLEKAKNWYIDAQIDFKKSLENLFPELKESEDEKIRKSLCKAIWTYIPTEEGQEYIAWLEKQGEQKVSEYDIVKTIKEKIIEHFDNHLIIDKCFSIGGLKDDILKIINEVKFAKQSEQKLDPRYSILDKLIEADDIYQMSVNDAMVEEARHKAIEALSKLEISKLLGLEKQGEQKPAWKPSDNILAPFEDIILDYYEDLNQM